jgi:UDP-N-acetylmuramyl pentapeptide phosphotransferase/UDP-N-acetylglucosamine-1-phosphate transferase
MIDGINGLSSGYCIMASAVFGGAFIISNDRDAASLAMLSVGALLPFFFHNVFGKKSKMFIGDGGTLLMGTIMSAFVIGAINVNSPLAAKVGPNFGVIAFVLAVLVIPVFDCIRVMISRILRKTSPFYPDKTHLHHLFIDMGFSHAGTSFVEVMLSVVTIAIWWTSYKLGASIDLQLYIVVALGLLFTFGIYTFLRRQEKNNTKLYHVLQKFGQRTHLGHTSGWMRFRDFLDRNLEELENLNK